VDTQGQAKLFHHVQCAPHLQARLACFELGYETNAHATQTGQFSLGESELPALASGGASNRLQSRRRIGMGSCGHETGIYSVFIPNRMNRLISEDTSVSFLFGNIFWLCSPGQCGAWASKRDLTPSNAVSFHHSSEIT